MLQLMEKSLKEKKLDIDNVEHLAAKIVETDIVHVQQTVGHLHSEWTSLESKVW